MSNLPDHVDISDSDAPWNQDHPEPDWQCRECDRYGVDEELDEELVAGNQEPQCPDCGSGVKDVYE